jgi:DNA-binding beta-propeller fold protein YncE
VDEPGDRVEVTGLPTVTDGYAWDDRRARMFVSGSDPGPDGRHRIVIVDVSSARVTSETLLDDVEHASNDTSLSLLANIALALSADGSSLALADAFAQGTNGIAVLSAADRRMRRFVGPFRVWPTTLTRVPAEGPLHGGGFAFVATRGSASQDSLFVMSSDGRNVTGMPAGTGGLYRLALTSDGSTALVLGDERVFKVDLRTRAVVGSVAVSILGPGAIAIAPDGRSYLSDRGNRDFPGSGRVVVLGPGLEVESPIDLTSFGDPGFPPVTDGVAVERSGERVFISGGSPLLALFPSQPRRLFIVDRLSKQVIRVDTLPGAAAGPVIVVGDRD